MASGRIEIWIQRSAGDTAIVRGGRIFAVTASSFEPRQTEALAVGAVVDVWTTGIEYRSRAPVDEPALIIFYGDTTEVVAPDTVSRDTSFQVSFTTFGGGCTRQIARTDVTVSGQVVEIRPYNRRVRAELCTDDLLFLVHRAAVRLEATGVATIRIVAEQRPFHGSGQRIRTAQLERRMAVR